MAGEAWGRMMDGMLSLDALVHVLHDRAGNYPPLPIPRRGDTAAPPSRRRRRRRVACTMLTSAAAQWGRRGPRGHQPRER